MAFFLIGGQQKKMSSVRGRFSDTVKAFDKI